MEIPALFKNFLKKIQNQSKLECSSTIYSVSALLSPLIVVSNPLKQQPMTDK